MNNFDRKIRPLTRKMIYISVLPSNHFQTHRHPKRERESKSKKREWARLRPNARRVGKLVLARSRRRDRPAEIAPSSFGSDHRRRDRPVKIVQARSCLWFLFLFLNRVWSSPPPSRSPRRPPLANLLSLFDLWFFFLLLLWWCGWWWFGGFCDVWWWVLCG